MLAPPPVGAPSAATASQNVATGSPLSCEPILRRMPDGSLLCVSQCGDVTEPAPGNRVYVFQSPGHGDTWKKIGSVYPESGEAVYVTEVVVLDGVVSVFLQVHSGRFLNMRCVVMQSRDSGLIWTNACPPPFFPTFCFVRSMLPLKNGEIILPCQYFPVTEQENSRLVLFNHNTQTSNINGACGPPLTTWETMLLLTAELTCLRACAGRRHERLPQTKVWNNWTNLLDADLGVARASMFRLRTDRCQ